MEIMIKYRPQTWGTHKWQRYSRIDSTHEWNHDGSAIDKNALTEKLESNDVIVEEDDEPVHYSPKPTAEQLKCKHDKPGGGYYEQMFGVGKSWRIEVCTVCKSIIQIIGDPPASTLPNGYPILKRVPIAKRL